MTQRRIWFERQFELGLPPEALPDIVERLRGTPARLEERIASLAPELLTPRIGDAWSIQENVGHLLDLEPLWKRRVEELAAGRTNLSPADLKNRQTHEAAHNTRPVADILRDFRVIRTAIVAHLESLSNDQLTATALHPRLQLPMNAVDLAFFVAEHDDHHLARITEIQRLAAVQMKAARS